MLIGARSRQPLLSSVASFKLTSQPDRQTGRQTLSSSVAVQWPSPPQRAPLSAPPTLAAAAASTSAALEHQCIITNSTTTTRLPLPIQGACCCYCSNFETKEKEEKGLSIQQQLFLGESSVSPSLASSGAVSRIGSEK